MKQMAEVDEGPLPGEPLQEGDQLGGEGEGTAVGEVQGITRRRPAQAAQLGLVGAGYTEKALRGGGHGWPSAAQSRALARPRGARAARGTASKPASPSRASSPSSSARASRRAASGRSGSGRQPRGDSTLRPQNRSAPGSAGRRSPSSSTTPPARAASSP